MKRTSNSTVCALVFGIPKRLLTFFHGVIELPDYDIRALHRCKQFFREIPLFSPDVHNFYIISQNHFLSKTFYALLKPTLVTLRPFFYSKNLLYVQLTGSIS